VAHALLRAASATRADAWLGPLAGATETSGGSSNNISPLKCSRHPRLSDIGMGSCAAVDYRRYPVKPRQPADWQSDWQSAAA